MSACCEVIGGGELSQEGIEIVQDVAFHQRYWCAERIGWIFIALILIAGSAGLFGHHPIARSTIQTTNGQLVIDYDRFSRYDSNAKIVIHVTPGPGNDGKIRLWFNTEYLDSMNVATVSPWPLGGEGRDGERAFVFQTDGNPFSVTLFVQFQTIGIVHGRIRANEQYSLSLTHLVWP